MKYLFIVSSVFLLLNCQGDQNSEITEDVNGTEPDTTDILNEDSVEVVEEYIIDTLEQTIIDAGLVNIQDIDPTILVDLKYSTTDNFMEKDMYGHMTRAYLQPGVAEDFKKMSGLFKGKGFQPKLVGV